MIVISIMIGILTLGFGFAATWPICVIWAAIAVSNSNQKVISRVIINNKNDLQ